MFFTHVSETRYAGFGYVAVGFDRYARAFFDELVVGVPIFFSISGFVMYRPFCRATHAGVGRAVHHVVLHPARPAHLSRRTGWRSWALCCSSATRSVLRGTGRWIANLGLVQ